MSGSRSEGSASGRARSRMPFAISLASVGPRRACMRFVGIGAPHLLDESPLQAEGATAPTAWIADYHACRVRLLIIARRTQAGSNVRAFKTTESHWRIRRALQSAEGQLMRTGGGLMPPDWQPPASLPTRWH